MGTCSKNFSFVEFEKSDAAKRMRITNVITTTEVRDAVKALVLNVLQPLRDAWGGPLNINSGYRCKALNEAVGGVESSQHRKGEAADVACTDPLALARLAKRLKLPFDQMIVYPSFVHFSHKLNGKQRGQILYAKSYKGPKDV